MGVDVVGFGEDLGTQRASVISPAAFRKWTAPAYRRLMAPCREAGALIHLHSDGHVLELLDDLLACGVTILNVQDLCNGIDELACHAKGRVCIDLDMDRQRIVPFGTRREIRELVREQVMKLGSPQGGLMLSAGIYPPTPPENVDALCEAYEEFPDLLVGRAGLSIAPASPVPAAGSATLGRRRRSPPVRSGHCQGGPRIDQAPGRPPGDSTVTWGATQT